MIKLTDKQEKFVQEYLLDLNATQAAIRAGYSEKTAQQMGSENLSKPVIQERIQQYREEQKEKFSISFEQKQKWLADIATYGMREELVHDQDDDESDPNLRQRNPSSAVQAIKELNLMDGDHAQTKQKIVTDDGKGGDAPITSPAYDLSKLSQSAIDELEKVAKGEDNED